MWILILGCKGLILMEILETFEFFCGIKKDFFLFVVANFNKKLGKTCSILHRLHLIKYSLRNCFKSGKLFFVSYR